MYRRRRHRGIDPVEFIFAFIFIVATAPIIAMGVFKVWAVAYRWCF